MSNAESGYRELTQTVSARLAGGGGPSLMYAASAIAAFDEFAKAKAA